MAMGPMSLGKAACYGTLINPLPIGGPCVDRLGTGLCSLLVLTLVSCEKKCGRGEKFHGWGLPTRPDPTPQKCAAEIVF